MHLEASSAAEIKLLFHNYLSARAELFAMSDLHHIDASDRIT